jgi:hypothetical protein
MLFQTRGLEAAEEGEEIERLLAAAGWPAMPLSPIHCA